MIERVFISGQLGKAVFSEGPSTFVVSADDLDEPRECTTHDLSLFFRSRAEISSFGPQERPDVRKLLEDQTQAYTALLLVISTLDADLTTHALSLEDAEELLSNPRIFSFVRRRLRARPLPQGADIEAALGEASNLNANRVFNILKTVQESQPAIALIFRAWATVADAFLPSRNEMLEAEKLLVELGVFDEMVSALVEGAFGNLSAIVVRWSLNSTIRSQLPRSAHLLNSLKNQLWNLVEYLPDQTSQGEAPEAVDAPRRQNDIRRLIDGFEERSLEREWRRPSGREAKLRVDAQIEAIKKLIHHHDVQLAEKWLRDLVEFHVGHGEKRHLAMSLCALATAAIDYGEPGFAETLASHAVSLGLEDPVIFNVRGKILQSTGRMPEALAEFSDAIRRFPDDPVSRNSLAEALKAMGRNDEALAVYNESQALFPYDLITHSGRAHLLKSMGRLDEALAAYDEATAEFPHEPVPRSGRAEVLKAMGRLDEALAVYNESMAEFPRDPFHRSGRAEVLKAMGRLDEALAAYDKSAAEFPDDPVACAGRADVLKAMGRFDDALVAYDAAMAKSPHVAVPWGGRADVLKTMGRFDEALAAYDEAMARFPRDPVPPNGRADVLKTMGRFDEALAAYDEALVRFPYVPVPWGGRADVLKAMGRFDEALAAYDEAMVRFPRDRVPPSGRADVLKAMGRFDEALAAYDKAMADFPHDPVAWNGRAEVLKAMGRFDEALAAYDKAVADFPRDPVAWNGRAEVLKAIGRFDEALAAYEKAMAEFPHEPVPWSGRADVLKAMGRFDEALASYKESHKLFPWDAYIVSAQASVLLVMNRLAEARQLLFPEAEPASLSDWIRFHAVAMLYMRSGNLDAAISRLSRGVQAAPWQEVPYFITALAIARIRREQFASALEALELQGGGVGIVERHRRQILIVHSQAGMGETTKATRTLQELGEMRDPNLITLRELLLDRYNLGGKHRRPKLGLSQSALEERIAQREFLIALA